MSAVLKPPRSKQGLCQQLQIIIKQLIIKYLSFKKHCQIKILTEIGSLLAQEQPTRTGQYNR